MLGSLTFFTGPMYCGKTLELVRHLQKYSAQQVKTVCLRPTTDTRSEKVQSRSGLSYDGLSLPKDDLPGLSRALRDYDVIGLDEAQFFTEKIVPLLKAALLEGKTVLIAGLDCDFRGEVFPVALALFSLPETNVQRTCAVCSVCRKHNATRTQRLKNGQPVSRQDPIVAVEGETSAITYEARCLEHHVIVE